MAAKDRTKTEARIEVETFTDHQIIRQPNPLKRAVKRMAENADDPVARAEKAREGLSDEVENWMSKECDRLAAAHRAIVTAGLNAATQDELFRAAHDIKGDAATFGFPVAAAAADSLCRLMEHAPDFTKVPNELIAHHVNAIQAIVRENRRFGVASVADELSKKLRGLADEYLTAVNQDRPEHLEVILGPSLVPGQ